MTNVDDGQSKPISVSEEDLELIHQGKFKEVHQRYLREQSPVPIKEADLKKIKEGKFQEIHSKAIKG
jgi:DNA-binding Xre family transcriptional regulator